MNLKTKKLIERHFYEYESNRRKGAETIAEIAEAGLIPSYDRELRPTTYKISRPTENKALKLGDSMYYYKWAKVVENTATAFQFEIQGDIIKDKFNPGRFRRLCFKELVERYGNGSKSVYIYRYNKIIDLAFEWAVYYGLFNSK